MDDETNILAAKPQKHRGLLIGLSIATVSVILLLVLTRPTTQSAIDIWRTTDFEGLTRADLYELLPGEAVPNNLYSFDNWGGDVWVAPKGVLQDFLYVYMRNIPEGDNFTFRGAEHLDREIVRVVIIRRFDAPFFGPLEIRDELFRAP